MSLAGNCAYALAQFGVLVVLARETGPAGVGNYALALAVTAPIQIGIGLRLRTVRATDTGGTPFSTYVHLAIVLNTLAAMVGTAVGAAIAPNKEFILVVVLVALAKSVEGVIDVYYGEHQRQEKLATIAISQLIRAVLTVILVALGANLAGLIGGLVAMLIGWTAQLVIFDGRGLMSSVSHGGKELSRAQTTGDLIRRSWPLGLAAAIASLTVSAPRFIVAGLLGPAAVGVLAVLSYPTTVLTLFANSLGQANVRGMTGDLISGNRRQVWMTWMAMVGTTAVVGVLGAGVVVLAGRDGVRQIVGAAYAENISVLLILVLAATLAGFATSAAYLLMSTRRFGLQPVAIIVTLVLAAPVIYVGTDHYGLLGTATALVFLYGLQTLLTVAAASLMLRRPLPV